MSRRSTRRRKKKSAHIKRIEIPMDEHTSTGDVDSSSSTTASDSLGEENCPLFSLDSTTAPVIGEIEKDEEDYATTWPELADKRVFSGRGIPFVIILIIMGFIFIQDNQTGNLKTWRDIFWTVQKCLFFIIMYLLLYVRHLFGWILKQFHRWMTFLNNVYKSFSRW